MIDRYHTLKFKTLLFFRFIKWPALTFILFLFFIESTGRCVSIGYQYAAADIASEASGKIISSGTYSLGKGGGTKRHNILYQYEVAGLIFKSKIIDYEEITTNASSKAEQYFVSREVRVFYDSSNPDFSVLEITPLSWGVIVMLTLTFLAPFIVVIWQIDRRAKKH